MILIYDLILNILSQYNYSFVRWRNCESVHNHFSDYSFLECKMLNPHGVFTDEIVGCKCSALKHFTTNIITRPQQIWFPLFSIFKHGTRGGGTHTTVITCWWWAVILRLKRHITTHKFNRVRATIYRFCGDHKLLNRTNAIEIAGISVLFPKSIRTLNVRNLEINGKYQYRL